MNQISSICDLRNPNCSLSLFFIMDFIWSITQERDGIQALKHSNENFGIQQSTVFYQHWKEVFKNQVTLIFSKSFFLNVQHRFIVWMKRITHTHTHMRAEEREMDEPKLVACECSTDIEENLGNSLLPNLLVAILNAIAVNQRKKNGRVTSQ